MLSLLVLALTVVFLVPAVTADEAKDQINAFKDQMKEADEATRIKLIEELAATGNAGAAKAISKFMNNRSTAVSVAAIKALGTLKDKKSLGKLLGMIKPNKDKPKVLAAVAVSVGEIGGKQGLDPLVKLAKKWLAKDWEVASAAATGLGKIPNKTSVDELIKLLDLTYPKQSADGGSIGQATRDLLAKSRPAIMKGLSELTGWDFEEPRAWKNFWEAKQKSWKPGSKEIKWADIKKWEDPGYGFVITKPDKKWEIARAQAVRIQLGFYELNSDEQRIMNAAVWVSAYDLSNYKSLTAAQKADQKTDWYKSNWKDVKEETFIRNDRYRVGKLTGILLEFTGQDSAGNIMKQKNVYFVHDNFMYEIGTWRRSGTKPELKDQVEKAIQSFRLTRMK
jgi:hypothetical protein